MIEVSGYTIDKLLCSTRFAESYLATRDLDGLRVVLKAYDEAAATVARRGRRSRVERERDAMRQAAGPGVPRVIEVDLTCFPPVLVQEWVEAERLDLLRAQPSWTAQRALSVAMELAAIVARVHQVHLMHCDIKPSNILIERSTERVHLIDFGMARPFFASRTIRELRIATALADDSIFYMSPEQSGRMARGSDQRSDLYSLGATLYFVLTGQPPFVLDDPLELIHAHIARVPACPTELDPSVPRVLAKIVMKLLRKEPADRYPSAKALFRDLQMLCERVARGQSWEELDLWAEAPARPVFGSVIFGREAERSVLCGAFQRAREGGNEIVLLGGAAGTGKSSLIGLLREPVLRSSGYLAQTKLDLLAREQLYAGISRALSALCNLWLTEEDEKLLERGRRLREQLGGISQTLVDLVPDLGLVLSDLPPVPPLGPRETRERLGLAMERLFASAATRERPIVLWIDDVQWADAGTAKMLERIVGDARIGHLLTVVTFRDGEMSDRAVQALTKAVTARGAAYASLTVGPLESEAVCEMLASALKRALVDVAQVVRTVERKTANNPLAVQSLVAWMQLEGALAYVHGVGWTWDAAALEAAPVCEDAVALVVTRIEQLSPRSQQFLEVASFLRGTFDLEQAEIALGRAADELGELCFDLCERGLLVSQWGRVAFAHDRIREAVQVRISPERRLEIQAAIQRVESDPRARSMPGCVVRTMVFTLLGRPDATWKLLLDVPSPDAERMRSNSEIVDLTLWHAVACAMLATSSARRCYLRALKKNLAKLACWSKLSPDFEHMRGIAAAEWDALHRSSAQALSSYDAAARRAEAQGYLHHAALAYERKAQLLAQMARDGESNEALQLAIQHYRAWGAHAKVALLVRSPFGPTPAG